MPLVPEDGVSGGTADPVPLLTMFGEQTQLRMGEANGSAT